MEGSPSVNALREGLRVSFSQRLEDVEMEDELGGDEAEEYEDGVECNCSETPFRLAIGIGAVGRGRDKVSDINGEVVVLTSREPFCGGSASSSSDKQVVSSSWLY